MIPTYYEEKLLEETLKQFTPALRERFSLEVIVSDGGSNDQTVSIARKYADVVIVHDEPNRQTIAEGRNIGAAYASGSILMFVNADTRLRDLPALLQDALAVLSTPGVVALTCDVYIYPEEERLSDWFFQRVYNTFFRFLNLIHWGMGRGECQIIKREVFEQVGGYAPNLAAGEDYDLYRKLIRKGNVHFLRKHAVYESPRRYRRFGYLRVSWMWFVNALSVTLFHRSAWKQWKPVR